MQDVVLKARLLESQPVSLNLHLFARIEKLEIR